VSERRVGPAAHVDAEVVVPGDKSISHRALILGALARGRSYIGNLSPAADVGATERALHACGVWVRPFGNGRVALEGSGPGVSLRSPSATLDCANSGTTMRLMSGVLAGHDCTATLDGDASLRRRPMQRVADPLCAMGADVRLSEAGTPPMVVTGHRPLSGIEWSQQVPSAQVKSAILLAALNGGAAATVVESQPTRDHTERLLRMCGAAVHTDGARISITPGPLAPFGLRIPGDISSAAFFLCLAASRRGWRMRCTGVGLNPLRTGVLDVLRAMDADVVLEVDDAAGGVEPQGAVEVRGAPLRGVTIAGGLTVRSIDEIPVLAVLATQAEGETRIHDAAELRLKETDRIERVVAGLRAFGANCQPTGDGLVIAGPTTLTAARVDSHGDHRLAMAWAIAAALADPATGETLITGAEAADVSYPAFFADLGEVVSPG
jgi:3-phosphoshikimate 1-carboxyvinyltransferase